MTRLLLLLFVATIAFAGSEEKKTVAEVKGQPIYMEDVQDDEILALRQKLFQKLEAAIAEKATTILENHPHDDDPGHVLEHFRNSVKAGEVKLFIDIPPPPMIKIPIDASMVSNPDAKLMILEFVDSQCPFCKEAYPAVDRLKRRMRKELDIVTLHYPLESHPKAFQAALAMECAREQGDFERYRQVLNGMQDQQDLADLLRYATQMKMADPESFGDCVKAKRYEARVKEHIALAESFGVSSTPTFVIGKYDAATSTLKGEMVEGSLSFEELQDVAARHMAEGGYALQKDKKVKKDEHEGHDH